jgi:dUTP pyrophosphatase
MDVHCLDAFELLPGDRKRIPTGLQIAIPNGYEGQIRPKSGLAARHGVTVLNAPGTIDSGFRGELEVVLINHSRKIVAFDAHAKIAQLVIAPVMRVDIQAVETLADTTRGQGGFGSTGD